MDYASDQYFSYSWHQSHDQATVLLMVPYETKEEDVEVTLQPQCVLAGVRGHPAIVKGQLFGAIDCANSSWQLEPRLRASRLRERTTSNTSIAASTQSSFALISEPEITSSFAASLEARSGQASDTDDSALHSPAMSSPSLVSLDIAQLTSALPTTRTRYSSSSGASRPVSPGQIIDLSSSYSSMDSSPTQSSRLLTLHLEKVQPTIWPSLIFGPLPEDVQPSPRHPAVYKTSHQLEHQYNMDATTLTLMGTEHHDIRRRKEDAFEYLIRAWHLQRVPSAAIRLVSHYVPLQADLDNLVLSAHASQGLPYYVQCLGGLPGVADLYLQAGLLYLEGRASHLLTSPSASLSSLRLPDSSSSTLIPGGGGTEAWQRDQRMARQFFERARGLQPGLEIPTLPQISAPSSELEMPSLDLFGAQDGEDDEDETVLAPRPGPRRRRTTKQREVTSETKAPQTVQTQRTIKVDNASDENGGDAWLLYVPGLIGVGTAMLVVGVVGALSFSWGRTRQGS